MFVSRLPPEIWRQIFSLSVHHPLLYKLYWDISPDVSLWNGWGGSKTSLETRSGSAIMQTKLALVLVCKEWREMANELLYSHLFIVRPHADKKFETPQESYIHTIKALLGALEGSVVRERQVRSSIVGPKDGYGWWTKRLDLPLGACRDDCLPLTLRLVTSLFNLQILRLTPCTTSIDPPGLQQLSALCTSRFPHSLRRVLSAMKGDTGEVYLSCIQSIPNIALTSLSLNLREPIGAFNGLQSSPPVPISFETIISLTLVFTSTVTYLPPTWKFPSLQHLSLSGLADMDIDAAAAFLDLNGASVISFCTVSVYLLGRLLVRMPRLQNFVLRFDRDIFEWSGFTMVFDTTAYLEELTYLGLSWPGLDSKADRLQPTVFDMFNTNWRRHYPRLQVIRIINEIILPTDQDEEDFWRYAMGVCAVNGVRLEDRHGGLLSL